MNLTNSSAAIAAVSHSKSNMSYTQEDLKQSFNNGYQQAWTHLFQGITLAIGFVVILFLACVLF